MTAPRFVLTEFPSAYAVLHLSLSRPTCRHAFTVLSAYVHGAISPIPIHYVISNFMPSSELWLIVIHFQRIGGNGQNSSPPLQMRSRTRTGPSRSSSGSLSVYSFIRLLRGIADSTFLSPVSFFFIYSLVEMRTWVLKRSTLISVPLLSPYLIEIPCAFRRLNPILGECV